MLREETHTALFVVKRRFGLRLLFNRKRQNDILLCLGERGEQKPRLNSLFMPGGYILPSVPDNILRCN